jgi:carbon starvation protein
VTGTAAGQKIFHSDAKIGFLAGAKAADAQYKELRAKLRSIPEAQLAAQTKTVTQLKKQSFNLTLDAFVTAFFLALVAGIFLISAREWVLLVARKKLAELRESPPTWLPDYAIAEARPLHGASAIALALALLRELSGEAKVDRAQQHCACNHESRERAYLQAAEERFNGINRCC